jgi:hypothetical protein
MNRDDVLQFLEEIQLSPDPRRRGTNQEFSLKQKYLEWVTSNPNANEKYFTMLGEILIDNCFTQHPASITATPKTTDRAYTLRAQLLKFLEEKSQYK